MTSGLMLMTSRSWCGVMVGTLLALAPAASSAATITVSIGSFTWDQFLGDSFSLQNSSALFADVASDFTDVSLVLTPDYDLDADGIPDAPFNDFPAVIGSTPDGNSFNQTYDGPFTSVRLQFRFVPAGLPELRFDQSFGSPNDPFFTSPLIDYSYVVDDPDPEPEPAPVPEPSTLLLLGTALGAAAVRHRRWGRAAETR